MAFFSNVAANLATQPLFNETGRSAYVPGLRTWAHEDSPLGNTFLRRNMNAVGTSNTAGWGLGNVPVAPIQPLNPFSRVDVGLSRPDQEVLDTIRNQPGQQFVPLAPETHMLPMSGEQFPVLVQNGGGPTAARRWLVDREKVSLVPYSRFQPYLRNPYNT